MLNEKQIEAGRECVRNLPYWRWCVERLDELFDDDPAACALPVVAARLALLDVGYGTGVWRRSNIKTARKTGEPYRPRFRTLTEIISAKLAGVMQEMRECSITSKHLSDLQTAETAVLVTCHTSLSQLGNGEEAVAASKYLHFCFPGLFPIQDGIVLEWLKNRTGVPITDYRALVGFHHRSLREPWTAQLRGRALELGIPGRHTAVRSLDAVLWLIGLAAQWGAADGKDAESAPDVNAEIGLYFTRHPEIVEALLAP